MKQFHKIFPFLHFIISLVFVACAFDLIFLAVLQLWQSLPLSGFFSPSVHLDAVLESIAMLTIAVAALELGQTILEEEVQRDAHMSAPTRVRRFLSRFLVALVVALSIESLVAVFRLSRDAPEKLPYAASVAIAAAVLLAAWGVFIRLNRSAEELEPEAMEEAKREDDQIQK